MDLEIEIPTLGPRLTISRLVSRPMLPKPATKMMFLLAITILIV